MVREDLDVVSVRYRLLNGPSVPVSSLSPTLLLLNLNTGMDSGGSLVVSLLLNKVSRVTDGIVSPWQGSGGCRHRWDCFSICCYKVLRAFFSCLQHVPPASSNSSGMACSLWWQ